MAYVPQARGFVVVRHGASRAWEYLLLTSRKWGEAGFPKGHVAAGESELQTARREAEEETGLGLDPLPGFRHEIRYPVRRGGRVYDKHVVYFLADLEDGKVTLSDEHTAFQWCPLAAARGRLGHPNLREVLRQAALYLKDPGLFDLEPRTEPEADAWLSRLPHAHRALLGHLRGGARLARRLAEALAGSGRPVHVEACAVGTLLHDAGRAVGCHDDHQRAGLVRVRASSLAAYGFACVSHFTKGATAEELEAAGLPALTVRAFEALVDLRTFTAEEQCAALADACMRGDEPVTPAVRFAELRRRYGHVALIDLQERRTAGIRRDLGAAIGCDPLALLGLV